MKFCYISQHNNRYNNSFIPLSEYSIKQDIFFSVIECNKQLYPFKIKRRMKKHRFLSEFFIKDGQRFVQ